MPPSCAIRATAPRSRPTMPSCRRAGRCSSSSRSSRRSPLNAIIGFSDVLLEQMFGELNEKQQEYLQDIHASGRHLLALINDILDLSKVEAGRMDLEVAPFALVEALENGLTMIKERAS